ncbi:MAG: hypothetical protein RR806_06175 [Oscillospiraceae bacterium]
MTWTSLAEILNKNLRDEDEFWNESAYRKKYQQAKCFYEEVFSKYTSENNYVKELQEKKDALQKERYKLQATKIETGRYNRQDSRFELFYENISNAIKRLPAPSLRQLQYSENDTQWVLGIGDIHYGATFISQNNQYSRVECKHRFEILLMSLREFITKERISNLKIINVADTIQGILRMTDLQINDIPVVECVVEISRLLAEFLNQLSAFCNLEYYHVSQANHPQLRPLGSKANEIATEDMEKIIISYISDLLADNSRITVISDLKKGYLDVDIFDFKCVAEHGHQCKNTNTVIKDLSNLHRKFYSYAFLGHTHASNETIVGEEKHNNIEVLTIPSFIGSDPYADLLTVGSKAMAKLFEFDPIYGHISSKNIILN